MKQTINRTQFHDAFKALRPDNFTYEGLDALYEYLTDLEDDTEIELDVIALCCDFREIDIREEPMSERDCEIADLGNSKKLIQNR